MGILIVKICAKERLVIKDYQFYLICIKSGLFIFGDHIALTYITNYSRDFFAPHMMMYDDHVLKYIGL